MPVGHSSLLLQLSLLAAGPAVLLAPAGYSPEPQSLALLLAGLGLVTAGRRAARGPA